MEDQMPILIALSAAAVTLMIAMAAHAAGPYVYTYTGRPPLKLFDHTMVSAPRTIFAKQDRTDFR